MNNNKIIVLLSGEISTGKSTLANNLAKQYNFKILKTKEALLHFAKEGIKKRGVSSRTYLQKLGEKLDKSTNGEWIVQRFQNEIREADRIVIDSVRIIDQINSFRSAFGYKNVFHIHLQANEKILKGRFFNREGFNVEDPECETKYKMYKSDNTEKHIESLAQDADLVINTNHVAEEDNLIRTVSFLRLLPSVYSQLVDVVIGAQFGLEGKGQIAAYLAPEYDCLIRVGGPNAGHKVYEEGKPDTFHIIPSGARRAPESKIIIGAGAVISLEVILKEIKEFELDKSRLIIDENATIISENDRIGEAGNKIGSTRQGVGFATANNILNRLSEIDQYKARMCSELKQYIGHAHDEFENIFKRNGKILLEGTQGSFLSLHHGFYPFVTSRDTSVSGCLSEAGLSPKRVRKIIMVTRRYPIRVQNPEKGSSGPWCRSEYEYYKREKKYDFVSEISWDEVASRSKQQGNILQEREKTTTTKKDRRVAEFSWAVFREAAELNSPTDIALTFADYILADNEKARRYDQLTKDTAKFIEELERSSGAPVSLIATGFNYRSIIDRRNWI